MLHTTSQGHQPSGSGEEDFLRVFTIYGRGGHLGHATKTILTNFRSPILRSLQMKYEFNWPSSFRGEDVWKCWRTDDGVTGILLAHQWAFGSGELKSNVQAQGRFPWKEGILGYPKHKIFTHATCTCKLLHLMTYQNHVIKYLMRTQIILFYISN